MSVLPVCIYVPLEFLVPIEIRRVCQIPLELHTGYLKPPCGLESETGPLQKQQVLLTAEPSFQRLTVLL